MIFSRCCCVVIIIDPRLAIKKQSNARDTKIYLHWCRYGGEKLERWTKCRKSINKQFQQLLFNLKHFSLRLPLTWSWSSSTLAEFFRWFFFTLFILCRSTLFCVLHDVVEFHVVISIVFFSCATLVATHFRSINSRTTYNCFQFEQSFSSPSKSTFHCFHSLCSLQAQSRWGYFIYKLSVVL